MDTAIYTIVDQRRAFVIPEIFGAKKFCSASKKEKKNQPTFNRIYTEKKKHVGRLKLAA